MPHSDPGLIRRLAALEVEIEDIERKRSSHRGSDDSLGAQFYHDRLVDLRSEKHAIELELRSPRPQPSTPRPEQESVGLESKPPLSPPTTPEPKSEAVVVGSETATKKRRGRTPGKHTKIAYALEVLQRRLKDGDSLELALIAKEAGIKDKRQLSRSNRFMQFYAMSIRAWEDNQRAHLAMGLGRPLAHPKRGQSAAQDSEPVTWDPEPDDGEDWESRVDDRGFSMPEDGE
jgi:hypothetical protein